jgi:neurotransmitter:Na+ symporter, NSS family
MAIVFTWFYGRQILPQSEYGHGLLGFVFPLCKYAIPVVLIAIMVSRVLLGIDLPWLSAVLPGTVAIGAVIALVAFYRIRKANRFLRESDLLDRPGQLQKK